MDDSDLVRWYIRWGWIITYSYQGCISLLASQLNWHLNLSNFYHNLLCFTILIQQFFSSFIKYLINRYYMKNANMAYLLFKYILFDISLISSLIFVCTWIRFVLQNGIWRNTYPYVMFIWFWKTFITVI